MYKFNQYEHKAHYGLPPSARLKGFIVVNEDENDILARFNDLGEGSFIAGYSKEASEAIFFKNLDKAKEVIEFLGKSLLVSAVYETKNNLLAACVLKYTPGLPS